MQHICAQGVGSQDLGRLIWLCVYSLCMSCMSINIFLVLRSVEYFNANVYSVAEERRQLSVEYVAWGVNWNVAMLSRSLFWSVWDEVLPIVVPDKKRAC